MDLLVQPKDMKTRKNLRLMQNDESTMIKNLIKIPVFDIKEAEDIIKFGFANRSTSKTNLNEASSRSHAVLCITLITINEFDEQPTMSHMCKNRLFAEKILLTNHFCFIFHKQIFVIWLVMNHHQLVMANNLLKLAI